MSKQKAKPLSNEERMAKSKEMMNAAYQAGGFSELVGVALGAASVCWDTLEHAGVFHSDEAKQLHDILMHYHNQECRLATTRPASVDAHSVRSGLFDPTKEEGDPEK